MPVTEIAHLILLGPNPSPQDFILAFQQVLAIQDNWYKTNADPTRNTTASPPSSSSSSSSSFSSSSPAATPKTFFHQARNRGAAFFQQVQDPKQILITAHWASVDEHKAWIASDDNKRAMDQVSPFIDLHRTVLFHVSNASLFPQDILEQTSAAKTTTTSSSSSTTTTTTAVAGGQDRNSKEGVSTSPADITLIRYFAAEKDKEIFEAHVTQGVEASQGRGGWRIEKDPCQSENILEYVVVAARCGKRGGADGDDAGEKNNNISLVDKFFLGSETRQYRRLC